MQLIRLVLLLIVPLGLAACASVETASRNALTYEAAAGETRAPVTQPYKVVDIRVLVPDTLEVSEANSFFPFADIVWREDPRGDRRAQVAAILRDAARRGTRALDSGRAVILELEVTRFHALTQKTRFTIGGTHDIRFFLRVLDAETGAMLAPQRLVALKFTAYGGARALAAMARGETQKVRITAHVARRIARDLAPNDAPVFARLDPGGHPHDKPGLPMRP